MSRKALLIFAKKPEAGKVKTRLAASVGDSKALEVYHQLLEHTVRETIHLPVDKFVFYADDVQQVDIWDNKHYQKKAQHGFDLGERMKNAFESIFLEGYHQAIVIGTDCPELQTGILNNAFEQLKIVDVVIGPAFDGGYYLLGLNQLHRKLFDNMTWSTPDVLSETIDRCKQQELSFFLMPTLHDVDEEKDLVYLNKAGA